jgi:hypothetical protein
MPKAAMKGQFMNCPYERIYTSVFISRDKFHN